MKALLVLAFGGPRSLEEVEPFLTRLFRGRRPSAEQLERVTERYRLIGGSSPLPEITQGQAEALERRLNERGRCFKSYVGMRYGHPLIEETLTLIDRDGIREVVALPMAPFRSRASTGAYVGEVRRAEESLKIGLKISFVEGWSSSPLFIDAVREKIREGLSEFLPEERSRVHLVFTAHSLPRTIVEEDPYAREIEESVGRVLAGVEPLSWSIAYQSKGGGPEEWAGPDVETVLIELSKEGKKEILVVPIGFVSDHVEVLYDIDILLKQKAESLEMVMKRTRSLNASERLIDALAAAVEGHLREQER